MFRPLLIAALLVFAVPALAQTGVAPAPDNAQRLIPVPVPDTATPGFRIEWEVKNRFRLFKNEADFQRHVAASRGDGVAASERTATALIEHAREVCARRPEDACRNLPKN